MWGLGRDPIEPCAPYSCLKKPSSLTIVTHRAPESFGASAVLLELFENRLRREGVPKERDETIDARCEVGARSSPALMSFSSPPSSSEQWNEYAVVSIHALSVLRGSSTYPL